MKWWNRRKTWQKTAIIAGTFLIALNTAASLVAAGSEDEIYGTPAPSITSATSLPTEYVSTTTTAPTETITTTTPPTTSTTRAVPPGTERVTLASVTDGDTVRVRLADGTIEKVRLIGINTPEIGECFADEATEAITVLLIGEQFTMTSDVSDRDRYDRLLRYLWLDDGTFVNESLVADGFALARDYPPDTTYTARLAAAQQRAETSGVGLWAPDACGHATGSGLQITDIEYDAPGNDNDNLNGEWVEITNAGPRTETMSSWVLKDESASHRYIFPDGFTLSPGSSLKVHTGCGTDTVTSLYWCNDTGAVWNNGGDTGFLLDTTGNVVDKRSY